MAIGGLFDSTSSAADKRIGVTDQGRVLQGNSVYGESGAVIIEKGARLNSGLSIPKGFKGNLTINGDAPALAQQFNQSLAQQNKQTQTLLSQLLDPIKQSLTSLATANETTQTGGLSPLAKTALWGVLIIAGAAVAMHYKR